MNNYPEWWDQTLTVYCKYEDPITKIITWFKTIVDNSFWKYERAKIKVGETIIQSNDTICRIPKKDNFLEKYQWLDVPNDEKENFFTLGIGDIIVRGSVDDDINEYVAGHRSTDFLAKYKKLQGCLVVEEVSINTDGGRGDEHYLIRGI